MLTVVEAVNVLQRRPTSYTGFGCGHRCGGRCGDRCCSWLLLLRWFFGHCFALSNHLGNAACKRTACGLLQKLCLLSFLLGLRYFLFLGFPRGSGDHPQSLAWLSPSIHFRAEHRLQERRCRTLPRISLEMFLTTCRSAAQ